MSEKIKLGLTRNRLFDFDNCVSFIGEADVEFDINECGKALKTLMLKEPLLGCGVEFCENGEAYVVTEKNELSLKTFQGDAEEFVKSKRHNSIDFSGELFSFVIINGKAFGIFAHTVVADSRSLMYLATEFMRIYKSGAFSVVPSEMKIVSGVYQMPSNAFSVVADRLAADLEMDWQKKSRGFTYNDYKSAFEKYLSSKSETGTITIDINEEALGNIRGFAQKEKTDVSSLVAFAFYESLSQNLGGKRKYLKLNVQADERVFFEDCRGVQVGAFNGLVTVEKKKNKKTPDTFSSNAVDFHNEIYKRVTSASQVFYNEFLFMKLPENFVDSQYIYCAGEFKHKCSKKLADIYGCAKEVIGEFCSYNLNQEIWSGLEAFRNVVPLEPLKKRSTTLITFVEKGGSGKVYFDYKKDKISDSVARNVVENVEKFLEKYN